MDNAAMIDAMARLIHEKALEIADEAMTILMVTPAMAEDETAGSGVP